ncbi:hypothetical protein QA639_21500 [Bradyrhizobium pachyrhizi]|uniref:hypothetical protein n=1 Tax=Bradyrhizobium pachyrhizi TaxID=280333 RepID=UPI0024B21452|nr:hypothetical protein [Bradyrhizobium pachyrhizi]WFU52287.1 hypothetical protein QA639_21500 [Bradyrhizobium pachyrhizi]
MSLQTIEPWCAVIAETKAIAEQYMEVFKLSSEIWMPLASSSNLCGRQFEHIVLIRPHWWTSPGEFNHFHNNVIPHWQCRLSPTGKMKVI